MVCGTFVQSGVPKNDLQHRVAMWNATGATNVSWTAHADGTFTVTAVFPPCPDNTTHDTESQPAGD